MKRKLLKISILLTWMSLSFIACGGSGDNAPAPAASDSSTTNGAKNAQDNPLSPGNLPPPGSDSTQADVSSLGSNTNLFFQRKELWDSFSEPLKTKVLENYSHSGDMVGAGPGGHGYYNTIFGRVSPKKASTSSSSNIEIGHKSQYFFNSPKEIFLMEYKSNNSVAYCKTFLCIDSPADGLNTVFDSVIVSGRVQMEQIALFAPTDPVMMISVFKQTGDTTAETIAQDIPITGMDITTYQVSPPSLGGASESQPAEPAQPVEIGVFNKTVPLAGPGKYSVVLTAFQNIGDSIISNAVSIDIYRQDNPTIELLSLTPPTTGNQFPADISHRHDSVKSGDEVAMLSVDAKIKIDAISKDAVQKNVGIIFQNLDLSGNLRYVSSGDSDYIPVSKDDPTPVKLAHLPLFDGYNKILVTAHNQQLDDFYSNMGLTPPAPMQLSFTLNNHLPNVKIKLISPTDASIIESAPSAGVPVSFCLTDLTSLPGRLASKVGECLQVWNGDKPAVTVNNYKYKPSTLAYDATSGIYSFTVKPLLGGNVIQVGVTNKNYLPPEIKVSEDGKVTTETYTDIGSMTSTFIYGKLNKLFENGSLKETDNLLTRGLSLRIDRKIITGDVKRMLEEYLNQESFKQSLRDIFKKNDSSAPIVCTKTGTLSVDHGDTTINFLPEGFNIGNIVVNQIEPKSDGRLYLDVLIQGFHGEADLRGFNAPVKVVIGDKDASFVPISVWIKELHAKIALRFVKENGLNKLLIEKQTDSQEAVTLVGDGPMGNVAHVNSTRNPLAAGLEAYDAQTGLLSKSFKDTLQSTVLCGVEGGLNNKDSGLPRWDVDLLKLTAYNNLNPFRIPLEFTMLNKLVGLDIAYDILRGDINFGYQSITLANIPLRITPSPRILSDIASVFKDSLIGSLSMPVQTPELPASLPTTDENKDLSLSLSEDAINQALFAATVAGMLDLDIDPNFYTNGTISFISKALPTAGGMFDVPIDVNQNGVNDDKDLPVLLRLKMNPLSPPALHFLNKDEVNDLAAQVKDTNEKELNKSLHLFRLVLSNVEIAFYRVAPISRELGGYKIFCALDSDHTQIEPDESRNSRSKVPDLILTDGKQTTSLACPQTVSSTFETSSGDCPDGYESFVAPVRNGPIISARTDVDNAPFVRFKANIVLHGAFQGIYQEVLAADKYVVDPSKEGNDKLVLAHKAPAVAPLTNFLRMKFATLDINPAQAFITLNAVENNTPYSDADLSHYILGVLVNESLVSNCKNFNEVQISIPDRIPKVGTDTTTGFASTLKDLGVDYLNLGQKIDEIPSIIYNDGSDVSKGASNPLYLDVNAHLGICYLGETCN